MDRSRDYESRIAELRDHYSSHIAELESVILDLRIKLADSVANEEFLISPGHTNQIEKLSSG